MSLRSSRGPSPAGRLEAWGRSESSEEKLQFGDSPPEHARSGRRSPPSVHTYINVMDQYHPAGRVGTDERYETINRRIQPREFEEAVRAAQNVGLYRLDVRRVRSPRLLWAPA